MVKAGHMGLAIHVSVSLFPELPGIGKEVTAYTYFQVKEDAITLYGFLHNQDGDMFRQLLGVSDIGPKGVSGILSVPRPDDLRLAIVSEDVRTLAKAPGIGNKAAQRLILGLKDRVSMDDVLGNMAGGADMDAVDIGASVTGLVEAAKEAVQAPVTPGYANTKMSRAVKQVEIANRMASEDMLKVSLKHLSFL